MIADGCGGYATPSQLAQRWHTTEAALAQLRYRGEGPQYTKLGRKVLYGWAQIYAYEQKNTVGAA